jgi:hypothetical protein
MLMTSITAIYKRVGAGVSARVTVGSVSLAGRAAAANDRL